ncbi:putative cONSERVED EXPORTED PROTEIN [Mycobacterium xenopi 4042]|uniref:Putative cONSERVED EXPORTED PROTEIN n=1 Tax=Mycobacterium xenopi 4042 TaxID=1299334 RepID=X7ZYE3_MYCXE|nr:putative cONSERVED EXPORTED PROTEIN [Mycobacterium xenopi 4042]
MSAARGGISTNWAIARPPGQTKALRPVIALHGKGSDAATVMAGGVEQGLAQAVRPVCRRSRWSPSTAAEAIGTKGLPERIRVPWC